MMCDVPSDTHERRFCSSTSKLPEKSSKIDIYKERIPGVALSGSVAALGFVAADHLGAALLSSQGIEAAATSPSPISGIPIAIVLGLAANNNPLFTLPVSTFTPGLKFCSTTILRTGIVLVGTKLSLLDVMTTGQQGIPVVIAAIGAGMLYIPWASRMAQLPERMGSLLAAGTSICGVTAITALAPSIKATSKETAVAVANVVLFGTMGMLAYPYLLHSVCSSSEHAGLVMGVAIHDTSQVLGGALTYKEIYSDEVAFKVAAITKLTRNVFLAGVIPWLTYSHHRKESESQGGSEDANVSAGSESSATLLSAESKPATAISGLATFQKYVPPFLLGFLGVAALRTGVDMYALGGPHLDPVMYKKAIKFLGDECSKVCLGTAMASVGLSTARASLKGVGAKPFLVGGSGAIVVGGTGFVVASLIA